MAGIATDRAVSVPDPVTIIGVEKPPVKLVVTPVMSALRQAPPKAQKDTMTCERCGAEMYRMHAVWRCPACRFKTDCCGW